MGEAYDRGRMVVEPAKDGSGNWYFEVRIETVQNRRVLSSGIYADGDGEDEAHARQRALAYYNEWREKQ